MAVPPLGSRAQAQNWRIEMRSKLSFVAVFFVMSATLGCATFRGVSARHEYIESQTKDYVYAKPANDVWPTAR